MGAEAKIELETRTCAGGCGRTFRTMRGSPTLYARSNCEQVCKGKPLTPKEAKRIFSCGTTKPRMAGNDPHAQVWAHCVKEARMCVARMELERLKIAELALKACVVTAGWKRATADRDGVYTLTRFAMDIGVKPATLRQWVRVKKTVVDKVVAKGRTFVEKDYHAAERTMATLKADGLKNPVKIKEQFKREKKDIAQGRNVDHSLRRFINLAQFLERRALKLLPSKDSAGELQEFAEALDAALQAVRKVLKQC